MNVLSGLGEKYNLKTMLKTSKTFDFIKLTSLNLVIVVVSSKQQW